MSSGAAIGTAGAKPNVEVCGGAVVECVTPKATVECVATGIFLFPPPNPKAKFPVDDIAAALKARLPKTFEVDAADLYFSCPQQGHLSSLALLGTIQSGQSQGARTPLVVVGAADVANGIAAIGATRADGAAVVAAGVVTTGVADVVAEAVDVETAGFLITGVEIVIAGLGIEDTSLAVEAGAIFNALPNGPLVELVFAGTAADDPPHPNLKLDVLV